MATEEKETEDQGNVIEVVLPPAAWVMPTVEQVYVNAMKGGMFADRRSVANIRILCHLFPYVGELHLAGNGMTTLRYVKELREKERKRI